MRKQRSGHIINFSSVGGLTGSAGWGLYCSTKFAVEGITEALAIELAPLGIHATTVEPGYFRTNFLDGSSLTRAANIIGDYAETSGKMREFASQISCKQPGDPVKLAAAIVRLAAVSKPPVHLPLGNDTLHYYKAKTDAFDKEIAEWHGVIAGTDHNDVGLSRQGCSRGFQHRLKAPALQVDRKLRGQSGQYSLQTATLDKRLRFRFSYWSSMVFPCTKPRVIFSRLRKAVVCCVLLGAGMCVAEDSEKPPEPSKRLMDASYEHGHPRRVTDASLYKDILDSGSFPKQATKYFPHELGQGTLLAFFAPFLQGGGCLQVAVPMTKEEMEKLEKKYADKTRLAAVSTEYGKGSAGFGKRPLYYLSDNPEEAKPFPNERDVVMLVMEDRNGGFHWNHGTLAGIAFDRERGQVVYWVEKW